MVVDERTDLSRGGNDVVIATDVRGRGETITRIVNVYDQKRHAIWGDAGPEVELAESHSAGWHSPRWRLQRP